MRNREVTVDPVAAKVKITETIRSTGDSDLNELLIATATESNLIEAEMMGIDPSKVEVDVKVKTRKEWVVLRVAPELIVPGQFIAVPKHKQTLSSLMNGTIVQGGARIEEVWDGGAGFGRGERYCSKRDWHIVVAGSSIPQCWSRIGTVPIAEHIEI